MIKVFIFTGDEIPLVFDLNVTHVREKDKRGIFQQFGGYTVASYEEPHLLGKPATKTNRMVIARCSDKETFSRHEGIRTCIRKIIWRHLNEYNGVKDIEFISTYNGRLISINKVIRINLVSLPV